VPRRDGSRRCLHLVLGGADVAGVLGSWEERFGARLVGVGSAELDVVVTRSPVDAEDAWVLAHEHVAFCLTTRPLSTPGGTADRMRRA
jgi:hypothetical protein